MKSQSKPRRFRPAFTIVELLVVISIISLLLAFLLPSLNNARGTARRALCGSNLRQFYLALNAYDNERRELPPGGWNYGNSINGNAHKILREEFTVTAKAAACPSSEKIPATTYVNWNRDDGRVNLTYFYLAGNAGRPTSAGSEQNGWLTSVFPSRGAGYYPPISLSRPYTYPANKVTPWQQPIMADFSWWRMTGSPINTLPPRANHAGSDQMNADGQNMLFADGHNEWQRPVLGESWKYFGTLYINAGVWITSSFAPPAAPDVFFFN